MPLLYFKPTPHIRRRSGYFLSFLHSTSLIQPSLTRTGNPHPPQLLPHFAIGTCLTTTVSFPNMLSQRHEGASQINLDIGEVSLCNL